MGERLEEAWFFPVMDSLSLIPRRNQEGVLEQRRSTFRSLPLPEARPLRSDEDGLSPAPAMVASSLVQGKT